MPQPLDLQEQEQIDALKAFWAAYGNLITWAITIVLAAFAAYSWYQWHAREQAATASTMFGEIESAAAAGDAARAGRVFSDLRDKVPRTTYAQLGGLLAAKVEIDKGRTADAAASLTWVAEHGDAEHAAIARLRLAGILADGKKYDDALAQLAQVKPPAFAALAADRRGDILLAKGQPDGAKAAWKTAWDGLPAASDYRQLVEAKLTALGAAPAASAASAATGASR
jgi:predicted negative regulator of RcsB-dependent stress response